MYHIFLERPSVSYFTRLAVRLPQPSHHFTFLLSATSTFYLLHHHITFHSQPSHTTSPFNTFFYILKYSTIYLTHSQTKQQKIKVPTMHKASKVNPSPLVAYFLSLPTARLPSPLTAWTKLPNTSRKCVGGSLRANLLSAHLSFPFSLTTKVTLPHLDC